MCRRAGQYCWTSTCRRASLYDPPGGDQPAFDFLLLAVQKRCLPKRVSFAFRKKSSESTILPHSIRFCGGASSTPWERVLRSSCSMGSSCCAVVRWLYASPNCSIRGRPVFSVTMRRSSTPFPKTTWPRKSWEAARAISKSRPTRSFVPGSTNRRDCGDQALCIDQVLLLTGVTTGFSSISAVGW